MADAPSRDGEPMPLVQRVTRSLDETALREVHDRRTASLLGIAVGVAFLVCFATGVWSHLQQHPPGWLELPIGPVGLYRFTQGLHVISGLVAVPLLLAKLYSVSPQLLQRPVLRGPAHTVERLAVLPLVAGSLFLLLTGAANIARWYPWEFFFTVGHWWAAWLVLGATTIHLAYKLPVVRAALARHRDRSSEAAAAADLVDGALTRRGLIAATAAAAALLTLTTAGQTVPFLRRVTWLAPRRPDVGVQGLPVNRTAAAAGTLGLAERDDFTLEVVGGGIDPVRFTLDDLRSMPRREEVLPISCVEGWSADAHWSGISVAEVLRRAGYEPRPVTVRSAQQRGGYRSSDLSATAVRDERCLLALEVNGEPLHADHGAPLRLIAPNRPGVLQTKWVVRLEVA